MADAQGDIAALTCGLLKRVHARLDEMSVPLTRIERRLDLTEA